jgi:hypothetical protein
MRISLCRNSLAMILTPRSWQECQLLETHTRTLCQVLRLAALTQIFTPAQSKTLTTIYMVAMAAAGWPVAIAALAPAWVMAASLAAVAAVQPLMAAKAFLLPTQAILVTPAA